MRVALNGLTAPKRRPADCHSRFYVGHWCRPISTYARGAKPNNMTLASAGFIFVFGGITLFLQDETFIKMKPTLVYLLFAAILGTGLARGRSYLKNLMGQMLPMDDAGWLTLTQRWTLFFVFLAVNETVWRTQSTDVWVNFKVFGFLPLTFISWRCKCRFCVGTARSMK